MDYKESLILRHDDLSTLTNAAKQDCGGDKEKAGDLISLKINELIDAGVYSPKSFTPAMLAKAMVPGFDNLVSTDTPEKIALALAPSEFDNVLHNVLSRISADEMKWRGGDLINMATEGDAVSSDYEDIPAITPIPELRQRLPKEQFEEAAYGAYTARCPIYDQGLIIRVTQELLWDSTKWPQVVEQAEALGQSTAQTIGKAITQTIEMAGTRKVFIKTEAAQNLAFVLDGTNFQSVFYNSTHVTVDGQVNNNSVTGNGFTWAGLNAAFALLAAMVDSEGKAIEAGMPVGLFPAAKEHTVRQLLQTPLIVGSPNNDINTFKGLIQPFFSPYVASATTYFLGDFKRALKWRWKDRPGLLRETGGMQQLERRTAASFRWALYFGLCWTDYRYVVKAT